MLLFAKQRLEPSAIVPLLQSDLWNIKVIEKAGIRPKDKWVSMLIIHRVLKSLNRTFDIQNWPSPPASVVFQSSDRPAKTSDRL